MKLLKTLPFEHESEAYEIRVLQGDNLINTVVFRGNYPANGFRYHIQLPKSASPEMIIESELFAATLAQARQDVVDKRWEKVKTLFT